MFLKYMDGGEANDGLFDLSIGERRAAVATMMGCNPHKPDDWPVDSIDRLLGIRQFEGERRFNIELQKMLSPYPAGAW